MARLSERCVCGANFLADNGTLGVAELKPWREHWLDTHRCLEYQGDQQVAAAQRMPRPEPVAPDDPHEGEDDDEPADETAAR